MPRPSVFWRLYNPIKVPAIRLSTLWTLLQYFRPRLMNILERFTVYPNPGRQVKFTPTPYNTPCVCVAVRVKDPRSFLYSNVILTMSAANERLYSCYRCQYVSMLWKITDRLAINRESVLFGIGEKYVLRY